MCKSCRYFDMAIMDVCWCRKLCVPLHEEADPCIMFEAQKIPKTLKFPIVPVLSLPKIQPIAKKATSHVRIKVFK